MMVDPRTTVINDRLKAINRIIAVSSGKGGVGKSMVAATLALSLANEGFKVGLFDLDFTSPTTHLILGAGNVQPKEDKGIVPPEVKGLVYMSLIYYSRDRAVPLRGSDVSNALIELLSVTQWGKLNYLIIDMPPGIGDVILDLLRLVKRIEFLIVTIPSLLAFETVKKQAMLLKDLKVPVIGVIENMKMNSSESIQAETRKLGLVFLGEIKFDSRAEDAIGNERKLLRTTIGKKTRELIRNKVL
jgi:ATP-binding protein involved in chromosome partitioning